MTGTTTAPLRGHERILTIGLVTLITLAAFEAIATATVMPAAREDLGGTALYGWAFSAFLLTSLVGIVYAGAAADRHGPTRPLILGLIAFGVGLLVAGLAPSMPVLVLGRAIQGIGAGVVPPVAYVAVGRGFDEAARPRIFALFATAWVVPGLLGPALAGAAADYLTWRLAFLAVVPPVVIAGAIVLPALSRLGPVPATTARANSAPLRWAVVLALGAGLMLAGVSLRSPLLSPVPIVLGLATGVAALHRLLPAGTLTARRGLPSAILGLGALNMAFFGIDAFAPFLLTEVRGQSAIVAGLIVSTAAVTWTAGTWFVERNATRWSRQAFIRTGTFLVAVGAVGLIALTNDAVPVPVAFAVWAVAALGIGLAYPNFSLITLASAPAGEVGAVTAGSKLAESLAGALGTGIVGSIVAAGEAGGWTAGAFAIGFTLMATVALGATALSTRLPGHRAAASALWIVPATEHA